MEPLHVHDCPRLHFISPHLVPSPTKSISDRRLVRRSDSTGSAAHGACLKYPSSEARIPPSDRREREYPRATEGSEHSSLVERSGNPAPQARIPERAVRRARLPVSSSEARIQRRRQETSSEARLPRVKGAYQRRSQGLPSEASIPASQVKTPERSATTRAAVNPLAPTRILLLNTQGFLLTFQHRANISAAIEFTEARRDKAPTPYALHPCPSTSHRQYPDLVDSSSPLASLVHPERSVPGRSPALSAGALQAAPSLRRRLRTTGHRGDQGGDALESVMPIMQTDPSRASHVCACYREKTRQGVRLLMVLTPIYTHLRAADRSQGCQRENPDGA